MTTPLAPPPPVYEPRWMSLLYERITDLEADNATTVGAAYAFGKHIQQPGMNLTQAVDSQAILAGQIFGG